MWPKTKLQNLGTQPPASVVNGNTADSVDNIIYLGSVLSFDGYSRPDINRRLASLALSVMSTLSHIWKDRRLLLTTKTHIYQALVLSILLYTAETGTLLDADSRAFEAFHMKCQRQLLQIKRHQFIWNDEITESASLPGLVIT